MPAFQGKLPRGLYLVFVAFLPIVKTGIAEEEAGILAEAAGSAFRRRKDFVVASEAPGCFPPRARQERLKSVHKVAAGGIERQ